jgi:hypothetical protein
MPVKVLEWNFKVGESLPEPLLSDDQDQFPVLVVKKVKEWLAEVHQAAEIKKPPTDLIIKLTRDPRHSVVEYKDVPYTPFDEYKFQHGQIEVIFKQTTTKLPLAKYYYLCARTKEGLCIVGAQLRSNQLGRIQ